LVVDDNPAIHDDFRKILQPASQVDDAIAELEAALFDAPKEHKSSLSFEIDSAHQGEQAIEMVERSIAEGRPYALAFVDVRMPPGLDGVETLVRLWRHDPRLQAVICTAYSDHTWGDMARTLGHSDGFLVLRKPFDTIEVLQLAHALASKWTLRREVERQLSELETMVSQRTRALETANSELRKEIAARAQAEDDLKHIATHDSLTGLPNRVLLHDRLGSALARARRHQRLVALLLLDLDQFKEVNDSYGHAAGDELLRSIAGRLKSTVRNCDTVARMGGDEFVVLLEDLAEPEDAAVVAKRLLEECSAPVTVLGHQVRTPPSIGIALYPHDCSDVETLLKSADLAMYQAKHSGRATYRFFHQGLLERSMERVTIREELERALCDEEFELWYQPLVDLTTGVVTGMEALLRWHHPKNGMVPPMKFIPAAERCGLIVPIGEWVLRAACRQLAEWHAHGATDLSVAVNVSATQLHAPGFVEMVISALEESGVDARHLEIEVTESTAFEDSNLARAVLERVAETGARIVIDDFGSGYSSLNRLKDMPVHMLKIDRFFTKDIADDPRDAAIVLAIVRMAHSLGIAVVAEGIENYEQLEFLRKRDQQPEPIPVCDRAQGFFLGRPLPSEAATTFLRAERRLDPALDMAG
jgi:diguanylate cyclase (GGDEF)-like protein